MYERKKLRLKNDYVFKAVFGADNGQSREMLRRMLNVILDRKEDPIRELTIRNPFLVDENVTAKASELDIYVVTEKGEQINVEMQISFNETYVNRTQFYLGKMVAEQLEQGGNYDKMKKVISISIVDGIVFRDAADLHLVFRYFDQKAQRGLNEIAPELYYLQLGRLDFGNDPEQAVERLRKVIGEMSELERLCCMIRYQGEPGHEDFVALLTEHDRKELIGMIAEKLEKMQMDERAYLQALSREKFLFVQKRNQHKLEESEQARKILAAENAVLVAEKAESDRARAAAELKNAELLRKIEELEKQLADQ